jgi:hypothetical protein
MRRQNPLASIPFDDLFLPLHVALETRDLVRALPPTERHSYLLLQLEHTVNSYTSEVQRRAGLAEQASQLLLDRCR